MGVTAFSVFFSGRWIRKPLSSTRMLPEGRFWARLCEIRCFGRTMFIETLAMFFRRYASCCSFSLLCGGTEWSRGLVVKLEVSMVFAVVRLDIVEILVSFGSVGC